MAKRWAELMYERMNNKTTKGDENEINKVISVARAAIYNYNYAIENVS